MRFFEVSEDVLIFWVIGDIGKECFRSVSSVEGGWVVRRVDSRKVVVGVWERK